MRPFSKVSTTLWDSEKFKSLPSDDARYLFLYVVTTPHGSSAGCFKLQDAYAAADMRWTLDRYRTVRQSLIDSGMIEWDANHSLVRIARWFDHSPIMNSSHQRGVQSQLAKLPSCPLRESAIEEVAAIVEKMEIQKLADEEARAKAGVANLPSRFSTKLMNAHAKRA